MKKKQKPRAESAVDYEVGLVSGSLSKSGSGSGSGSLSALFTTSARSTELFQPAPEIVKSVESKEKAKDPEVQAQKKKVQVKETPEAETRVQDREQGLQAADEADRTSVKSRKRKSAPGAEDEDGPEFWVKRRQKLKENKQKERAREKRTVFVGNLPLSSTKKTLRVLFKDKGPIESIRFRSLVREDPSISQRVAAIMRKAHPQRQSINAYVVFKEEQSVASALDRNGLELEPDLFIRVDRVCASDQHDHKRSVFVGNLPFDLKEASLRRHFEDCGSVEGVRLIRDPKSGLGKGFGYVLFKGGDGVQLALKLDGSKLEGRAIRVKRSVQLHKPGTGPGTGPGAKPGSRPGTGPGAKPGTKLGSRPRSRPGTGPGAKPGTKLGSRPRSRPGTRPGTGPGAKPGTKLGSRPRSRPGTGPGTGPGAKPGTKLGSRPRSRPGTGPGTGPGAKPGQFRGEMADPTTKKNKKFTKKLTKKKAKGKK